MSTKVTVRTRHTICKDYALKKLGIEHPGRDKNYHISFSNNDEANLCVIDVYTEEEKTLGEVETFGEKEYWEP